MSKQHYPSDLTQDQWQIIKVYIPKQRAGGRRRSTNVREALNAILYLLRTGCAWRYLPKDFPNWRTVYDYFKLFRDAHVFEKLNFELNSKVRSQLKRSKLPHLGIIDSQAIKNPSGETRGYEGFKKVRGRKRSIIVDANGLIWGLHVHSANDQDAGGGVEALDKLYQPAKESLEVILADKAYDRKPFKPVAEILYDLKLQFSKSATKGYSTMRKKRWIVERTFAWFNNFRRLSKDYEKLTASSEAMIFLAMCTICLHRLTG